MSAIRSTRSDLQRQGSRRAGAARHHRIPRGPRPGVLGDRGGRQRVLHAACLRRRRPQRRAGTTHPEARRREGDLQHRSLGEPRSSGEASREFGAQAVVASIDVRARCSAATRYGRKAAPRPPAWIRSLRAAHGGARRRRDLLTAIDRDGTMRGYDLELIAKVTQSVGVPVIAAGGAGSISDFRAAVHQGGAAAVAAGAMFVFHGPHRAVLITYPNRADIAAYLG